MRPASVALIGRPNVGKSTLFNRLLRKRRAITDPTPGVTRDPVIAETTIKDIKIKLIDTGGFKLERDDSPEGELESIVVEKTLAIIKNADIVVLIFEAGETTPEDEEFIALLRPFQNKMIAVVNKCEGGRREADAWNLLSYGFEKIFMISAEHGDNIGELTDAIVQRLASIAAKAAADAPAESSTAAGGSIAAGDKFIPDSVIRIALLGKPNTGKSTLSNHLTSSESSIVTNIPGTTRDVVEGSFIWKKNHFMILDTAGIRRKTKVSGNIEYYSVNRAIKTIDEADIIFLIIDAQEWLTDQDKKIAALAHDKGRGIILVLNKWDTMPQMKNTFQAVEDRIRFLFGQMEYAPVINISAEQGSGIDKLLQTAVKMYNQLTRHIETSELNQAIETWVQNYPPPTGRQTRFKIKYAVQASSNPVHFIFFISRKDALSDSYAAYLRNRIRDSLGFSLIPVSIEFRSSSGDSKTAEERRQKSRRQKA